MRKICSMEDCERPAYAKGLCGMHYKRQLRHGSPTAGERARVCSVEGCGRAVEARGWCHGHYLRWRRNGDVQPHIPLGRRRQPESCVIDGCDRGSHTQGLCRTHYKRLLKHGDPLGDVPVRVVTGEGWLSHGYWNVPVPPEERHLTNGETQVGEHRLVMARHLGRALYPDEVVHHINGNRTDNRLENLELWSTAHPKGQRVDDKIEFALRLLQRYRPDLLREPQDGGDELVRFT